MMKLTHILGMASEWISLQSYLNTLVANVFPLHISWMSELYLVMTLSNFVATVTSRSRNLKSGLFIFYSVLSRRVTSFGRIWMYLVTFSFTSDNHFS